jgi:broad specificity phosphatase PhoE
VPADRVVEDLPDRRTVALLGPGARGLTGLREPAEPRHASERTRGRSGHTRGSARSLAGMTDLLVVRHGLSAWNKAGRWQGWADIELAPEGEEQAREAAPTVAGLGLTAVVHSGMHRTRRTAELLVEGLGLPDPEVEPGFKEHDVGDWSGLTRAEIEARWPGMMQGWFDGTLPATPGGESREGFSRRVIDAVHRIAFTHPHGRVLAVAHGGVVGSLQRVLAPGAERPRIGNLMGRWLHIAWEDAGESTRVAPTLGELVHLLPPADETESPSA